MCDQTLINERGYEGKYVALASFLDRAVIAFGDDPKKVVEQANKEGHNNPVIFFVPQHDMGLVY
ncbi:MAG: DUF5678 domain-containing protein [Phycisphaerae bacterium]